MSEHIPLCPLNYMAGSLSKDLESNFDGDENIGLKDHKIRSHHSNTEYLIDYLWRKTG